MRKNLFIVLLLTADLALGEQKVWLDPSGSYYDPINPNHRKFSYIQLPLLPEGEHYRIRSFYADGQLQLEGFTSEPEWQTQQLIGEFQEWYPNGQEKNSGNFIAGEPLIGLDTPRSIRHGVFTSYYSNGQLATRREYNRGRLVGAYDDFDEQGQLLRHISPELIKEYHQGQVIREEHYKDGEKHGPQLGFSHDGVKLREEFYKDGRPFGLQQRFYDNGQLQQKFVANSSGKAEGEEVHYRRDGSLSQRIHRKLNAQNEVIESIDEQFYENAQLKRSEAKKREGSKQESIEIVYRPDGNMDRKHYSLRNNEDFEEINERYHSNEILSERERRKPGYQLSERYNENGELIVRTEQNQHGRHGLHLEQAWGRSVREHYVNGLKQGAHRTESSDGSIIEGQYKDDKKTGEWVELSANGTKSIHRYKDGELHGLQEVVYGEGKRREFSTYLNGKLDGDVDRLTYEGWEIASYSNGLRHGDYQLLTFDGRPLRRGHYVHGEPDGVHHHFAENGRMISRESYRNGIRHGEWLETDYKGEIARKRIYDQGQLVDEWTPPLQDNNSHSLP